MLMDAFVRPLFPERAKLRRVSLTRLFVAQELHPLSYFFISFLYVRWRTAIGKFTAYALQS